MMYLNSRVCVPPLVPNRRAASLLFIILFVCRPPPLPLTHLETLFAPTRTRWLNGPRDQSHSHSASDVCWSAHLRRRRWRYRPCCASVVRPQPLDRAQPSPPARASAPESTATQQEPRAARAAARGARSSAAAWPTSLWPLPGGRLRPQGRRRGEVRLRRQPRARRQPRRAWRPKRRRRRSRTRAG